MAALMERLAAAYDPVIVDTPPVLAVTDPVVMAPRVDGVVLVVGAAKTTLDALRRTREALGRANANVLGVILNKLTARSGGYYYQYSYRQYYGDQESADAAQPPGPTDHATPNGPAAEGQPRPTAAARWRAPCGRPRTTRLDRGSDAFDLAVLSI
ncbi:MAG TPA: hypothetical protein VMP03_14855 [Methylomirabilota bacterium]|nr:hypothetical protein [Methylomirabilota bacterium]